MNYCSVHVIFINSMDGIFLANNILIKVNAMYKYYIFGYNIESDYEIEGAVQTHFDTPDITVKYHPFPDECILSKSEENIVYRNITSDEVSLAFPEFGFFKITKNVIEYRIVDGIENSWFSQIILCWLLVFNMVIRKDLLMHGSCISYGDNAFIISGESGAGKSSITDALLNMDYGFLSDDIVRICPIDSNMNAIASFPLRKLCGDTMDFNNLNKNLYKQVLGDERDKFFIDAKDIYINDPKPVKALFHLDISDEITEPVVNEITGGEKIKYILKNLFQGQSSNEAGNSIDLFMKCSKLGAQISVLKITRPREGYTITQRAKMMDQIIKRICK